MVIAIHCKEAYRPLLVRIRDGYHSLHSKEMRSFSDYVTQASQINERLKQQPKVQGSVISNHV